MWDNCTCHHLAVRDFGVDQRRLMHRVTVNGSVPHQLTSRVNPASAGH
jgi:alpha-ketoglutarate-dependent taurine dioxygenase